MCECVKKAWWCLYQTNKRTGEVGVEELGVRGWWLQLTIIFCFFSKENVFVYYLCNENLRITKKICAAFHNLHQPSQSIPRKQMTAKMQGACWEGVPTRYGWLDCCCCIHSAPREEGRRHLDGQWDENLSFHDCMFGHCCLSFAWSLHFPAKLLCSPPCVPVEENAKQGQF